MNVLQINTTVNTGSTGRIAEEIGKLLISKGEESYIAFGRNERNSQSKKIRIGGRKDFYAHVVLTRLLDRHGFGSHNATKQLIKTIKNIQPDIIHLHNVHGYYLNIEILFDFLNKYNKPIIWTLHDCWPFTGHCAYFEDINCTKWKTHCHYCPKTKKYPGSWLIDNSYQNFIIKKQLFTEANFNLVVPSEWLKNLVLDSFLKDLPVSVIYNGVDLETFKFSQKIKRLDKKADGKKIILGVANIWQLRKGLKDFIQLSKIISEEFIIVLVGLTNQQIKKLPNNIIGITRTDSISELVELYSAATVFVNPTYSDNFPTTNIEALACGTPVVTYDTGGSPEAIDKNTGFVAKRGDIEGLWLAIEKIERKGKKDYIRVCRNRAIQHFSKKDRYQEYLALYESLL